MVHLKICGRKSKKWVRCGRCFLYFYAPNGGSVEPNMVNKGVRKAPTDGNSVTLDSSWVGYTSRETSR